MNHSDVCAHVKEPRTHFHCKDEFTGKYDFSVFDSVKMEANAEKLGHQLDKQREQCTRGKLLEKEIWVESKKQRQDVEVTSTGSGQAFGSTGVTLGDSACVFPSQGPSELPTAPLELQVPQTP